MGHSSLGREDTFKFCDKGDYENEIFLILLSSARHFGWKTRYHRYSSTDFS